MLTRSASVALACLLALPAAAQEEKKYENKELKVRFGLPEAWTLRDKDFQFGWDAPKSNLFTLAEFLNDDNQVGGILIYQKNTGYAAGDYGDAVEKAVKPYLPMFERVAQKSSTKERDVREYKYKVKGNDNEFRQIRVYTSHGKHNFQFVLWCFESLWDTYKDPMYKAIDTFKHGDADSDSGTGGGDEKPTMELTTPADLWKGWGKGSSLSYVSESSGMKVEMKYVLLDHKEGESYVVRNETTMMGNTTKTVMKFNVKKPDGDGSGDKGPKVTELGKGEEELEVAGKKLKCKWVESETEANGAKTRSKVWTCEEIANGGLVKSESVTEVGGNKVESKMMLVAFEKK